MTKFLTELDFHLKAGSDNIYVLDESLMYHSSLLKRYIEVPVGFETDLASVPRVPFVYSFWGGKAHREGVLHDYLYRIDSFPVVSFSDANEVFFEAMKLRGKGVFVRYPMWWGVCLGGRSSYHKKRVGAEL